MFKVLACGMLVLSLSAPALAQQAEAPSSRYKLRDGDMLDLNFTFVPEFNQTITIQPDGFITLRAVGDLKASGLTVPELKKAVEAQYAGVLNDPVVAIELKDFEKPYFLAQGQVQKPGKYDLRSDITVSQAVAVAGGLNEKAKHSQVLLFRRVAGDKFEVKEIDLKQVLDGKQIMTDVVIKEGDMVFVPQNRMSKVKQYVPLPYLRFLVF